MNLESLHWWHWMAVGLIAGLGIGLGRMQAASDRAIGGEGFISQAAFERELRLPPVMGKTYIDDLSIHPARDVDLVSLQELDPETLQYRRRWFAAQRPYHPLAGPGAAGNEAAENGAAGPGGAGTANARATNNGGIRSDYTIYDYLEAAADANPRIVVRLAWWDSPRAIVIEWMLMGAVVIGGIWPPVVALLIGAGLGRKKKDDYDLDRFHHGAEPGAERRELSEEERRRLAELELEMMAGLADSTGSAQVDPTRSAGADGTVRAMNDDLPAAAPEAPGEWKDYAGEYYPVEKKGRTED